MPVCKNEPWERQKGESEKAYEAFSVYRDLEEKRTFTAVAEKLKKSGSLIHRWKDKWNWEERVLAYDNKLEREATKKAVREYEKMKTRHIKTAISLQTKAMQALEKLEPEDMTARDIKDILKMATDLERLNREPPQAEKETIVYKMEIEDMDDVERDIYGTTDD